MTLHFQVEIKTCVTAPQFARHLSTPRNHESTEMHSLTGIVSLFWLNKPKIDWVPEAPPDLHQDDPRAPGFKPPGNATPRNKAQLPIGEQDRRVDQPAHRTMNAPAELESPVLTLVEYTSCSTAVVDAIGRYPTEWTVHLHCEIFSILHHPGLGILHTFISFTIMESFNKTIWHIVYICLIIEVTPPTFTDYILDTPALQAPSTFSGILYIAVYFILPPWSVCMVRNRPIKMKGLRERPIRGHRARKYTDHTHTHTHLPGKYNPRYTHTSTQWKLRKQKHE